MKNGVTMFKPFLIALFLFSTVSFINCGDSGASQSQGLLFLGIQQQQNFNPNADHGQIEKYKLTISGSQLDQPIEKYYSKDEQEATIEGLPAGSQVRVELEAINSNDIVVRRGKSQSIHIIGGQNAQADLAINNVPIFANVRDGAIVYNNRFQPKIFAPGEINFQVSDTLDGHFSIIEDTVSDQTHFSISESVKDSVLTINAAEFSIGEHELMVKDPDTGEFSKIKVRVLEGQNQKALATSAGAYLGTPMSDQSHLVLHHRNLSLF